MIIDRIENANLYTHLSPHRQAASEACTRRISLRESPASTSWTAKTSSAMVHHYETRTLAKSIWEAHRKYIDVQYVASGVEKMGWSPIGELKVQTPYMNDEDAELYTGAGRGSVIATAGTFTIFFPEDGHMPGLAIDDKPSAVSKTVVKVRVG